MHTDGARAREGGPDSIGESAAARRAAQRAAVEDAFRSLPSRYLGAGPGFAASYRIILGDLGRVWEVRVDQRTARVTRGTTLHQPDVTLRTDAETWLALRRGEFSGIDAFSAGKLRASGNIDHAVAFEGLFRLPNGRPPLLRIRDVAVGREHLSTLTVGEGQDVIMIHGLGATRASLLTCAAELGRDYRVHAVDLPGFGASSKPSRGRYDAAWFAEMLIGLMDTLEIDRAHLIGNSMGGRIAIEMGLNAPDRVSSLGLLSPAVAWIRRDFHHVVRLLRPEFGFLPHRFSRRRVSGTVWGIFHDLDAVDPELGELLVDEFLRIYGSAGARHAFLASARNIYLDRPFGDGGFYPRLAGLQPPALFVWGSHDPLVPPTFAKHVSEWLPSASQVTLDGCGHVPQVERPVQTLELLRQLLAGARPASHIGAATPQTLPKRRPGTIESAGDGAAKSRRQSAA
ncbi:MAG: alpha/beta fold hydrolase [Solirubrobacteraceae bacterium]